VRENRRHGDLAGDLLLRPPVNTDLPAVTDAFADPETSGSSRECPCPTSRGIMTRAVEALVSWTMNEQGIRRLTLTTHVENEASQRVALRAGFVRIGVEDGHEPPYRDGTTRRVVFELSSAVHEAQRSLPRVHSFE